MLRESIESIFLALNEASVRYLVAGGLAGVTTADGRFTIVMPHPERVFRSVQWSWHPDGWGEDAPWMRVFRNARAFLG
jgi:phosphoribosylformylglycinamidine synthase